MDELLRLWLIMSACPVLACYQTVLGCITPGHRLHLFLRQKKKKVLFELGALFMFHERGGFMERVCDFLQLLRKWRSAPAGMQCSAAFYWKIWPVVLFHRSSTCSFFFGSVVSWEQVLEIRTGKLSLMVCLPALYQALIQMEAPGDPACPFSVQKEENVTAVWPPGFLRTGRTPDLPGIQVLLQDPGESECWSSIKVFRFTWTNCFCCIWNFELEGEVSNLLLR